jgi:epoxyqueuosine reductase
LPDLLRLDESAFRRRFGGTSLARTRRRGLLRNAAVVLGNSGNPAAVPALSHALGDREPLIRQHAAWALGALRLPEADEALVRRVARETHPAVLAEITSARRAPPGAPSRA